MLETLKILRGWIILTLGVISCSFGAGIQFGLTGALICAGIWCVLIGACICMEGD